MQFTAARIPLLFAWCAQLRARSLLHYTVDCCKLVSSPPFFVNRGSPAAPRPRDRGIKFPVQVAGAELRQCQLIVAMEVNQKNPEKC